MINLDPEQLAFYDIEVFKYDSLIVFMDIDGNEIAHFWSINGHASAGEYLPNGFERVPDVITGKTLVGYNNYSYDDVVLYGMLHGYQQRAIKSLNDQIIAGNGEQLPEYKAARTDINSLDTMQQLTGVSLKQIEANKGKSIIESVIDFGIDRPLTKAERRETLQYCRYDVLNTIDIYTQRKTNYFDVKRRLILMLDPRAWNKATKWNTTTISDNILLPKYGDTLQKQMDAATGKPFNDLLLPKCDRVFNEIPPEIWQGWRNDENISADVTAYGAVFTFARGGLHGVPAQPRLKYDNVKLLDVASMYPSIIVNLGVMPSYYDDMRKERIQIKKSDPVKAAAYKSILNSVYGNLKQQHSKLYCPAIAVSVCAYGQIALFDLCGRLHAAGYELVNINTDGVAFVDGGADPDAWQAIADAWQNDYKLTLELDTFKTWVQKDVNNYVALFDNGDVKTKGGDVKKYGHADTLAICDTRIIDIAITDYLLKGVPVADTINGNTDDPALYQFVLKQGRAANVYDELTGNQAQRVNRVFAVKPEFANVLLRRTLAAGNAAKFPDAPENMRLFNGDLTAYTNFKNEIDADYYINLANDKLLNWHI